MNSGQGVNYEVSGCVLITAESDAVPVYRSLAGIVFCFRIIASRADTPRRFVLGGKAPKRCSTFSAVKKCSHLNIL